MQAYETLGDRVVLINDAQSALARELCMYHSDLEGAVEVAAETLVEVDDE